MFLLFCLAALAGDRTELVLRDGTVLRGEVLSVADEVYRFQSDSAGLVEIPVSRILKSRLLAIPAPATMSAALSTGGASPPAAPAEPAGTKEGSVQQLQRLIAGSGERLELLQLLKEEPALAALLSDPALLKSLQEGDAQALQENAALVEALLRLGASLGE
jgi:hypothetical protein